MHLNLPYVEPPRGHEIELRTICALIHIGDPMDIRIQQAMLRLNRECFAYIDHRIIFDLVQGLFSKQHVFDLIEVMTIAAPDQHRVISLAMQDQYCSTANLEYDVAKLLDYRQWRIQLRILVDTVNLSMEYRLPEEALESMSLQLQALSKSQGNSASSIVRSYHQIADEFLSEENADNSDFSVEIPGLPRVPNRALITIAGRSGHGKTFFALYLMDKIIDAQPGKQTLYFNLEMHERVMLERHARLLGVQGSSRREVVSNGIIKLLPKQVSLISEPMITIDQIETESRLASLRQPIAVIVVDYLGLVGSKTKYDRKDLQQGDISKRLAALSIELDCDVICLIQVNREFKTRPVGDRCPLTTDAAESMGSVHSSSWWIGIDRPDQDDNSGDYQHLFQVRCRKNRGDAGNFELNLKFQNGMFHKWTQPFSVKRESKPSGF